jgi:hypothetical protein
MKIKRLQTKIVLATKFETINLLHLWVELSNYSFMETYMVKIMMFAGNFAPRGWAFCDVKIL